MSEKNNEISSAERKKQLKDKLHNKIAGKQAVRLSKSQKTAQIDNYRKKMGISETDMKMAMDLVENMRNKDQNK